MHEESLRAIPRVRASTGNSLFTRITRILAESRTFVAVPQAFRRFLETYATEMELHKVRVHVSDDNRKKEEVSDTYPFTFASWLVTPNHLPETHIITETINPSVIRLAVNVSAYITCGCVRRGTRIYGCRRTLDDGGQIRREG